MNLRGLRNYNMGFKIYFNYFIENPQNLIFELKSKKIKISTN